MIPIAMKRFFLQILTLFFVVAVAYPQNSTQPKVSLKSYSLKYTLIFFIGCAPRVLPDNITFTEGDCSTNAYSGDIVPRGTRVELTSVSGEKGFAKVLFKYSSKNYEVLLKNDSRESFRRAFDLLFTEKTLAEWYDTNCPNDIKTKKHLIKCIGFPIRQSKSGDVERYFYILEFAGPGNPYSGYDGFTVEIRKGKIINVSGYI